MPDGGTARRGLHGAAKVLSHPLVLLAVGAIVSGILVPSFTRGAQDHRQSLEIRSGLVSDISDAASPFLAATQANVLAYNGDVPRSYDVAYQQWVARGNEVWTKLRTYMPGERATEDWTSFTLRMRDVYYFFRLPPSRGGTRDAYVDRTQTYFGAMCRRSHVCPQVDFGSIDEWLASPNRRFDDSVNFAVEELFFGLRAAMAEIQGEVLDTAPSL